MKHAPVRVAVGVERSEFVLAQVRGDPHALEPRDELAVAGLEIPTKQGFVGGRAGKERWKTVQFFLN